MPRILYAIVGAQLFRHFSDISECQAFTHRALDFSTFNNSIVIVAILEMNLMFIVLSN